MHAAPLKLARTMATFPLHWQHHFFSQWTLTSSLVKAFLLFPKSNPQSLSFCCTVPEEQLHNIDEYDLNVVRLCFQAFLPDEHGNYTLALPPLISNPIYDNSKHQLSQMLFFFFLLCLRWKVPSWFLSSFLALWATSVAWDSVPDACLPHSNAVSIYSQDHSRVKFQLYLLIWCFLSPCFHITVMTTRKDRPLTCWTIKIVVRRMAAIRLICFPRMSSQTFSYQWGVLPLTWEGFETGLLGDI